MLNTAAGWPRDPTAGAISLGTISGEVLAGGRRHLALLEDRELAPVTYKSCWGEDYNIEQMLEHAVVHPSPGSVPRSKGPTHADAGCPAAGLPLRS